MVVTSILVMGGLGFLAAVLLSVAARVFYVKEDPRIESIKDVLPGLNCRGCGLPGCAAAAAAIVKGKAHYYICQVGGTETADAVARIMGVAPALLEPQVTLMRCKSSRRVESRYHYAGAPDCRAEAVLYGGSKQCETACLGHGTCVTVCGFNAIRMGPNRIPVINPDKCKRCRQCVKVCPTGVISIMSISDHLLHLNQTSECLAPCIQKCPAHIDVPRYIQRLRQGDFAGALLTIKERNPLPASCGRVCLHPCETICRRNIAENGVAINGLQRFLSEWEMESGRRLSIYCAPDTGHRAAIIGGGPAGLACAYFLRRLGHHPTIFEAKPKLGGMLSYGIPEYRLPKRVVDWEIEGILKLGIEARTQCVFGQDFNFKTLQDEGFAAVFLGIGAWVVPPLGIPGETAEGVIASLEFLDHVGRTLHSLDTRHVVVIGESNTAMDCSRSCIRLGAKSVTVLCPCNREDMSASKRDIEHAIEEGVHILFRTQPIRAKADSAGHVTHLEYIRLTEPAQAHADDIRTRSGSGSETLLQADMVIVALERKPDLACLHHGPEPFAFKITAQHTLDVDEDTMQTARPHVFAAGDLHTGRDTVIKAVAGGRRAARSMHYFLTRKKIPVPENLQKKIIPKSILKHVLVINRLPRIKFGELPVEIRRRSFTEEVQGSISRKDALLEARRCLNCGLICYDSGIARIFH
ncbi:MAG: FAD-dependent oxidoreductase [Pseudomonadota bacterium]